MKSYWGNWMFCSTLICFGISTVILLTSPSVSGRRARSSRHHKPHQEEKALPPSDLNETQPTPVIKLEALQNENYEVCAGFYCGIGRECRRDSDGLPNCICIRQCPTQPNKNAPEMKSNNQPGYLEYGKGFEEFFDPFPGAELAFPQDLGGLSDQFKPVCATDGKIYPNECEVYRTACITNQVYLHVDESGTSCVGQAPGGGGGVGRGNGRDQKGGMNQGRAGNRGLQPVPNTGGNSQQPSQANNPFGDQPSFSNSPAGGDNNFPLFSSGIIPNFDVNFPPEFAQGGEGGEGFPYFPEPSQMPPPKGGQEARGKGNPKNGAKSHGKLTKEGTGAKAAASEAREKWIFPQRKIEFGESEEDDDEDDDEEDDEEDSELDGFEESGTAQEAAAVSQRRKSLGWKKPAKKGEMKMKKWMPSEPRWEEEGDDDVGEEEMNPEKKLAYDQKDFKSGSLVINKNKKSASKNTKNDARRGSSLCTREEYEILKDALLIYNHQRLISKKDAKSKEEDDISEESSEDDPSTGSGESPRRYGYEDESTFEKEYLLSLMFAHFDQNNNGKLDYAELQKVGLEQKIRPVTIHCHLVDFLRFDDMDHDNLISPNEFYSAFSKLYSISILGNGKPRAPIHLTSKVGTTLEIKCSLAAGSISRRRRSLDAPRLTQWFRYGVDVSKLDQFEIQQDGTLLINQVELIHAGNYSCHDDSTGEKVIQPYILQVEQKPSVKVQPHIKWERPGANVEIECHAQGEPLPQVIWLKNDSPVVPSDKYEIKGNGITLKIKDVTFADTGAYMCQAENEAGKRLDISSLVVIEEQTLPPVQLNESQFLVFHDRGISTYDPENCRLQHQILGTDIIPGTQRDLVCGSSCEWGRALKISSTYVYVSQPKLNRVLIISISQMVVVDLVLTDRFPVQLFYVPQVDQVWIECWREAEPYSTKSIQVIRGAKEKKKHRAIRPKPLVSLEADLVQNVFLPEAQTPFDSQRIPLNAYISHKNTRGLYKMDLRTLRYTKSIDLTSYNCLPEQVHFTSLYGFVILECKEPVLHQPTGQLVLDIISDAVISYKSDLNGRSFLSKDSRKLVTMVENVHDPEGGTSLLLQYVEANGLRQAFDVNTSLNISDVAFFPSQRFHTYDLYATAVDKEDVLFLDLESGNVELVPGVGKALQNPSWERNQRPIASEDVFGKYLVTPSSDAVYVVNGRSHTVNCQIGGMTKPNIVVWL